MSGSTEQRLWLDAIDRELLTSGALRRYIAEYAITGLTSNPTIFEQAVSKGSAYDETLRTGVLAGKTGEALFFDLAIEDLRQAADLFRSIHESTGRIDGWVSLEVSPFMADDAVSTLEAAMQLYARAHCPNLMIKIPGTLAGNAAIEEAVFEGVPVNVTLLFSSDQYLAAAEAYIRGIERRLAAGRDLKVASVASFFVSRWDAVVHDRVAPAYRNRLGIAIAHRAYAAYRALLTSARWQNLARAGAQPQRLLWASTGTKDPAAPPFLYAEALALTLTINTLPEKTLLAYIAHGRPDSQPALPPQELEALLAAFRPMGFDQAVLAEKLQRAGVAAFARSWTALLQQISTRVTLLRGEVAS